MENFLEVLKLNALFKGIEEPDLQSILSCLSAKVVHFEKSQVVFMSGESTKDFGIVLSGQVQVIQEDFYGNRCIIANIDAGNLFGETFACAGVKTIPVSVFTVVESNILLIDYSRLAAPCANGCAFHSRLIFNMLNIVATKNLMLTQKIEFTSKRTTREKLLSYLSVEAQKDQNNCFYIPFNRQELADYLSVDRSAMSAELCRLRDDGILKFNKSQFELL